MGEREAVVARDPMATDFRAHRKCRDIDLWSCGGQKWVRTAEHGVSHVSGFLPSSALHQMTSTSVRQLRPRPISTPSPPCTTASPPDGASAKTRLRAMPVRLDPSAARHFAQSENPSSSICVSRKKIKCSGERPICSYCARLKQTCTYLETESTPDRGFRRAAAQRQCVMTSTVWSRPDADDPRASRRDNPAAPPQVTQGHVSSDPGQSGRSSLTAPVDIPPRTSASWYRHSLPSGSPATDEQGPSTIPIPRPTC